MSTDVELDIYSGRPNPLRTLDRPEVERLNHKLKQLLIPANRTNLLPSLPSLGYRGFHIHTNDSFPNDIVVFDGIAQTEHGNYRDPRKLLEEFLCQLFLSQLDQETSSFLRSAINQKHR